jgi:CubicO group peptidase (beta-lactamase class C family)
MRPHTRKFLVFPLLAVVICAASGAGEPSTKPRSPPAAVGLDNAALDMLDRDIAQGKFSLIDHLLVIRCGQNVFERSYPHDYRAAYGAEALKKGPLNAHLTGEYNYFDPQWHPYLKGSDLHTLQSATKTVTSVVYGVAITRGDFKASLDTPALQYFKESSVRNVDDRKRRMTLRDVLTMSAGLDWNEELPYDDPGNTAIAMEAADDWVRYVIDRPMAHEPGTVFAYSSGVSELLAYIFLAETGQDIERYAEAHLFGPLGIKSHHWKRTPKGLVDTEGGLYLRAEDLAKIGLLYLHNGSWDGKVIIAPDWITQSLQARFDVGPRWKYGYQWWLRPHESSTRMDFAARGFGGQLLFVAPQQDIVLVVNGWQILGDRSKEPAILDQVLAAVRSPNCPAP